MAVSGAGNHIPRNSLARTVHTGRTSTDEIDGCGKGEARLLATGPFGPPPAPSRAPFGARKGPVLFSGAVGCAGRPCCPRPRPIVPVPRHASACSPLCARLGSVADSLAHRPGCPESGAAGRSGRARRPAQERTGANRDVSAWPGRRWGVRPGGSSRPGCVRVV